MKRTKLTRFVAVGTAVVMSIGCITFNAFAEEFSSGIEVEMEDVSVEEEAVVDETVIFGDEVFADGDLFQDSYVEGEELFVEEGTEEDAATDGLEILFSDEPEVVEQPVITLNYEEYTLVSVGETVLLEADVTGVELETEEAVPEEVVEEVIVAEEFVAEVFEEEMVVDIEADEEAVDTEGMAAFEVLADVVSWTSSDESVATVDSVGVVTAVATGEAVITCALNADQNVFAVCKITVQTECVTPEHVHSYEECLVREQLCNHVNEDEHVAECFKCYWKCGMEEHVHNEECFENTEESQEVVEEVVETEVFTSN